jgi:putative PIN family toxin of toxin-antitoxin system
MLFKEVLPLKGNGKVTKPVKTVVDTNVFVSASLSKNPNSPTRELLQRWKSNQFTLLICNQIAKELIEKLAELGVPPELIDEQMEALAQSAEWVEVPEDKIQKLLTDSDDNVIVACAVIGKANYIITYDPHFDSLGGEYQGIKILKAIPFLEILRNKK